MSDNGADGWPAHAVLPALRGAWRPAGPDPCPADSPGGSLPGPGERGRVRMAGRRPRGCPTGPRSRLGEGQGPCLGSSSVWPRRSGLWRGAGGVLTSGVWQFARGCSPGGEDDGRH